MDVGAELSLHASSRSLLHPGSRPLISTVCFPYLASTCDTHAVGTLMVTPFFALMSLHVNDIFLCPALF